MMEYLVLRTWRLILNALLVVLAATVVGLAVTARVGPAFGFEIFAIRTGSMAPDVGVGALVIVDASRSPVVGDVISYRTPNGATVTHRVEGIVDRDGSTWIETHGDANADPDPALTPSDAVIGVVAFQVALLGFVLALLAMPSGIVSLVATAGALLTALWLIEGAEGTAAARRARRRHRRRSPVHVPYPLHGLPHR